MQSDLPSSVFAFPKQRKEPLTDARHVRNAVARFDQVTDVPDADRERAFANIKKAAAYYGIDLSEEDWHDLGVHPQPRRKTTAAKGAATTLRPGLDDFDAVAPVTKASAVTKNARQRAKS